MRAVLLGGLCWLLCACATETLRPDRARASTERSLLLVTMDTTRADALGCYGNPKADTPVLDRLASEGVRFTRASTSSPMTVPSHASMFTGLHPFAHGVRVNGTQRLAEGHTTLAELLSEAGLATHAEVAASVLDARYGLAQGFDAYGDVQSTSAALGLPERVGDDVADASIRALRSLADSGRPFFLWAHFFDPHHPFEPPGYRGDDSEEAYLAEVTFMDAQIGRIVEVLRETGLDRSTIVVLVGDHGEAFDEHGEVGHGYFVYRTTMDVPFIMWGPSILPAGRVIDAPVRTIDIAPTVLDLLGIEGGVASQGSSLVPVIDGDREDLDLLSYGESLRGHLRFGLCPVRSLERDRWKLIWSGRPALFDLRTDPSERHDLFDDRPDIAEDLRRRLFSLVEEAGRFAAASPEAVALSAKDLSDLQALGYLGGSTAEPGDATTGELELLQLDCVDPTERAEGINLSSSAVAALALGRYGLAEEQFRQLLDQFGAVPRLTADLARAVAGQRRIHEAIALFEQALTLAPQDTAIRTQFVEELIGAALWSRALEEASILATTAPDRVEASHAKGMALVGLGRLDDAVAEFERGRSAHPEDERPVRGLVLALSKMGKFTEAESILRRRLADGTRSALLLRDLAYSLERQGRASEALATVSEAVELSPKDGQILKYRATLLANAGRSREAFEMLGRALERSPTDLEALMGRAALAGPLGASDEVVRDFERARALAPDDPLLARGMARYLTRAGRPSEAEAVLRDALRRHPDAAVLLGDLAFVAQSDGRPEVAHEHYRRALAADPELESVRAMFAEFLITQGRLDEAATMLESTIAKAPDNVGAHFNLGLVYSRQERLPEAIERLTTAGELAPDDVRPRFARATVHLRAGQPEQAAALCEEVLRMDPGHAGATQLLSRIRTNDGS